MIGLFSMSSRRSRIPSATKEGKPGLLPASFIWEHFSCQVFHSAQLPLSFTCWAVRKGCSGHHSLQRTSLPSPTTANQYQVTGRCLISKRLDSDFVCSNPGHSVYWLITLAKLLNFLILCFFTDNYDTSFTGFLWELSKLIHTECLDWFPINH